MVVGICVLALVRYGHTHRGVCKFLGVDRALELPRCWMDALKETRSGSNQRPVATTNVHASFIFALKQVRVP